MQSVITNLNGPAGAAPAQQEGLNLTSMCSFNGMLLGAGTAGMFKTLCGATDDATAIAAYFTLGSVDLGEMYQRIRYVYLGLRGTGNLQMTVTTDLNTVRTYSVVLSGTLQQRGRVLLDRNVKGRYWDFKIANVSGVDFSIDYIQLFYF